MIKHAYGIYMHIYDNTIKLMDELKNCNAKHKAEIHINYFDETYEMTLDQFITAIRSVSSYTERGEL